MNYLKTILFCFLMLEAQSALTKTIVTQGEMTIDLIANGRTQMEMSRKFQCVADQCNFSIRTFFDDTTNSMTYIYTGECLYKLLLSEPANKAEFLKNTKTANVADGVVDILDAMPIREDGSYNQILWLAYGSSCYFRDNTSKRGRPLWTMDDPALETNGFTVPILFQTNQDSMGLPSVVEYLSDGIYRGFDRKLKTTIRRNYNPPFGRGFTNAEYRVIASTNILGISIPIKFEFIRYSSPLNGKLLPRLVVRGNATNAFIQDGKYEFSPPVFEGVVNVHDHRLKGNLGFTSYFVTNGNWPDAVQRKDLGVKYQKEEKAAHIFSNETSPKPSPHNRHLLAIALALCACLGLAVMLLRKILH